MGQNTTTDKLERVLREVNDLDSETKRKIFINSAMTDSDFDMLRVEVDTLIDDIEANVRDNLTTSEMLEPFDTEELLRTVFKDRGATADDINLALFQSQHTDIVALDLYRFDQLTVTAQKRAIADHKAAVKKADKERGEKLLPMTSDDCREELSRDVYRFFFDGHRYDQGDIDGGLE